MTTTSSVHYSHICTPTMASAIKIPMNNDTNVLDNSTTSKHITGIHLTMTPTTSIASKCKGDTSQTTALQQTATHPPHPLHPHARHTLATTPTTSQGKHIQTKPPSSNTSQAPTTMSTMSLAPKCKVDASQTTPPPPPCPWHPNARQM